MLLEGNAPPELHLTDSYWVEVTSDEVIQNALDNKERNVMSWRDRFDEGWILLVLDGLVGASMLRPHEEIIQSVYQSSFHRAFIMAFNGKRYKELRLHSSKPTA